MEPRRPESESQWLEMLNRQEVRDNQSGTSGGKQQIESACAARHRNPVGPCVLCCLFRRCLGVMLSLGSALTLKNGFAELCGTAGD